jgi:nucleoid-associated protein YgaU
MKFARLAVAAAAFAAVGVAYGCKNSEKKPPMAISPSVTDVRPVAAPVAPPPIIAQPAQPVVYEAAPAVTAAATGAPASATSAGGTSYTVQKGDTLSKIARSKYGEVNAVRKIKEANPGVDYNNIKPGQKLMLP